MAAVEVKYTPNPPELLGVDDLSLLVYLEMPNVLDTLEHRYLKLKSGKAIYTSISTVLIAVNPYEWIKGIYADEKIDMYKELADNGKPIRPPHPFAVGARGYQRLLARGLNQSVVVCGESGAGKTETTKRVIQYLACTTPGADENAVGIEQQIMAASPILETYGNAKTVWNNNSSRFGKFTKLLYSMEGGADTVRGQIVGSTLETYLLEKSRVVGHAKKERSYHSFYFINAGLNEKEKADMGIDSLKNFWYTKQGGKLTAPGINDEARFQELDTALKVMKVSADDRMDLFKITMGILQLGNVDFEKDDQGYCFIKEDTKKHVEFAAKNFCVKADALTKRLTTLTMSAVGKGKKGITKKIPFEQAVSNRDAIAKGVYEKTFKHLATLINKLLFTSEDMGNASEFAFIGVLDVFGFENFKINSLEQLCINFTNEKLQDFFNLKIIAAEQEEYLREAVVWQEIDVPDCGPMLKTVEAKKTGLFYLLDSACQAPKPDVEAFHQELFKKQKGNKMLKNAKAKKTKGKKKKKKYFGGVFSHFADNVTYDFEFFLVKNMEKVTPDTQKMFNKSKSKFVKIVAGGKVKKKRKFTSLTSIFVTQLNSLMKSLTSTEPYFIRCVNPNKDKSGEFFSRQVIQDQLRCGGIIQALRVLSLGYPTRVEYVTLYNNYHPRITNPLIKRMPAEKFAAAILIAFGIDENEYELGLTKIFFKPAKAAIFDEIMAQADNLTEKQTIRVLAWLAKRRIGALLGSLKVNLFFATKIRDARARQRWLDTGRIVGHIGNGLIRYLKKAKDELEKKKLNGAAVQIQKYWVAYTERKQIKSKMKKVRKATKKVMKAHKKYVHRMQVMVWLKREVENTRIRLEEERKRREEEERLRREAEEAIRKAEEEARILAEKLAKKLEAEKREEEARILAEKLAEEELIKLKAERKAAEKLAEEEARILAEKLAEKLEAERKAAAEKARLRQLDHEKKQLVSELKRNIDGKEKQLLGYAKLDDLLGDINSTIDGGLKAILSRNQQLKDVADCQTEIDKVRKDMSAKWKKNWEDEQNRLADEAEKQRIADEEAKKKAEQDAKEREEKLKQVRAKSMMVSKSMALKKQQQAQEKRTNHLANAEDVMDERAEDEEDQHYGKRQQNLADIGWTNPTQEEGFESDNEEGEAQVKSDPGAAKKFSLSKFRQDAANGQLFRKYKYRKNVNRQERYIKVTFDDAGKNPMKITWGTGNRFIDWKAVKLIAHGHHTPTFTNRAQDLDPKCCLSVVSQHTILDIENESHEIVKRWVKGLRLLLNQSDAEAQRLENELRKNPPITKKQGKTKRRKQKTETKKGVVKQEKKRTESLILLQKDLFIMTTTTVFRNLEEEYYPVTQELKQQFNPNEMYDEVLKKDIPWRQWQNWIRQTIITSMGEKGLIDNASKEGPETTNTTGEDEGEKKECIVS